MCLRPTGREPGRTRLVKAGWNLPRTARAELVSSAGQFTATESRLRSNPHRLTRRAGSSADGRPAESGVAIATEHQAGLTLRRSIRAPQL